MEFTWYFLLYGIVIIGLNTIFFIDDRRNNGANFKYLYSMIFGLALITCVFSSVEFVAEYRQYWLQSRRVITLFLRSIQFFGVVIIHYGF